MSEKLLFTTVTVGVIAYNEQDYLPRLLEDLINQSYPKELTEVVLVDGCSTDKTKQVMERFALEYNGKYLDIKVLDNPKRIQPAGWNVVIANFSAEVLLRIDAHAELPYDFIEKNMECINSGEYVCGGPRENIIDENTAWKRMLLDAEKSLFGSGIASYRNKTDKKKEVKSVFHGAYRREVFDKVGLFNEKLIRTEDNEFHYRVREAGYRICYNPQINSFYQTRNSVKKMIRQKYLNGFWIGKTLFYCPKCISVFHLAPLVFVVGCSISLILALFGVWQFISLIGLVYCSFLLINTLICFIRTHNVCDLCLPFIILLLHISYGVGTISGIMQRNKRFK